MDNATTKVIARGMSADGRRCFLAMHEHTSVSAGKEHKYFFVTRGDKVVPPQDKLPDAVIALGFYNDNGVMKIVLTDEYRLPIGRREIGMVAGLIDREDYDCSPLLLCGRHLENPKKAACVAAIREFKQETGLEFLPHTVSTPNLYSSAGMTDESVCIVIGVATGTPSKEFLEEHEDIETGLYTLEEAVALLDDPDLAFGKHTWAFLWAFKQFGFPNYESS